MKRILPPLPDGYEFLPIGSVIQEGDMFNSGAFPGKWRMTSSIGSRHAKAHRECLNMFYIRKSTIDLNLLWE